MSTLISDIDFSNTPDGTINPGTVGGDIADLDNIDIETPASQGGATGTGSWGVDTGFGANSSRNALLFDFTNTPGGNGIGHFGADFHDVESGTLAGRAQAEFYIYNDGVVIDSGTINWGSDDGDGESHFWGYIAAGPEFLFDQVVRGRGR